MKLIVGLGNPGNQYKGTLHNVGFTVLDHLADKLSLLMWKEQFQGECVRGSHEDFRFMMLKPTTYMNLSGESVQACQHYFKIELADTLVVFDDLDLPVGKMRYRTTGGDGGHKGIRSMVQHCGGKEFHRLRVGIGRPERGNVSNYVLSKPSQENASVLEKTVQEAANHVLDFIRDIRIQIPS